MRRLAGHCCRCVPLAPWADRGLRGDWYMPSQLQQLLRLRIAGVRYSPKPNPRKAWAAINRELERESDTYKLFLALRRKHVDFARKVADLAIEAIVAAGDFKLASDYLPHPESYLLWRSDRLNDMLGQADVPREQVTMRRDAYVHNYCRDVQTIVKILKGLRDPDSAKAALEWAIALVTPRQARTMVCKHLVPR